MSELQYYSIENLTGVTYKLEQVRIKKITVLVFSKVL